MKIDRDSVGHVIMATIIVAGIFVSAAMVILTNIQNSPCW